MDFLDPLHAVDLKTVILFVPVHRLHYCQSLDI